ncbi:MAG: SDR family oxidoreductase [Halioglobus sp.]
MGILQDKAVVITGGAGDIGKTCAERFIAEGARVLLVARNEERLREVAAAIHPQRCLYYAADITQSEQVAGFVDYAIAQFGCIDIFLSNAGISGPSAPIEDYPQADFEQLMSVNVTGTWLGLKYVIPQMKKSGNGGSIVITSSGAGLFGLADLSGYVTSKHALTGLMRGAALECADHNIRVNLVCPGPVKSAMTDAIGADFGMTAQEYEAVVSETIPMKRYASLDEVAAMMLYLSSDASSYCTGSIFPLDGGKSMH